MNGIAPPKCPRVSYLDALLGDMDPDRFLRPAREKDGIESGPLYLPGKESPAIGISPAAGEGGFPHHHETAREGGTGPGQESRAETQVGLGGQGVDAGLLTFGDDRSTQAIAGQKFFIKIVRQPHRFRRTGGQIHHSNLTHKSACHHDLLNTG